jgi:hypothetical protein
LYNRFQCSLGAAHCFLSTSVPYAPRQAARRWNRAGLAFQRCVEDSVVPHQEIANDSI